MSQDVSPQFDAWLRLEFEQNFLHLRDRDEKVLGLVKTYVTLMLGIASVSVTLLGLQRLNDPWPLVGWLLVLASCVGEMLLLWIVAYRGYFVTCARQLNAIRLYYGAAAPANTQSLFIQPLDPRYPPYFHWRSAYAMVFTFMSVVNAAMLGMGAWGVLGSLACTKISYSIPIALCIITLLANAIIVALILREKRNE